MPNSQCSYQNLGAQIQFFVHSQNNPPSVTPYSLANSLPSVRTITHRAAIGHLIRTPLAVKLLSFVSQSNYFSIPTLPHLYSIFLIFLIVTIGKRFRWSRVACWPLVPKFAGSNPAEGVGILGRKNPQQAFIRRGSKAVGPMS